jgi:cytochrome b561
MSMKNTADRYGHIAQLLHWVVVALIITQFVLASMVEDLPRLSAERLETTALHKSVGLTVLLLAAVRLVWRALSPPPLLPSTMKRWERSLAQITHWGLYGIMFALPLSGWLWSSASNYPVSWFGLVQLPDLVQPAERLKDIFHEGHEILGTLLLSLAVLHALAALKHHFIDRDSILRRMLPWG